MASFLKMHRWIKYLPLRQLKPQVMCSLQRPFQTTVASMSNEEIREKMEVQSETSLKDTPAFRTPASSIPNEHVVENVEVEAETHSKPTPRAYMNSVILVGKLTEEPTPVLGEDNFVKCYKLNISTKVPRAPAGDRSNTAFGVSEHDIFCFKRSRFSYIANELSTGKRVFVRGNLSNLPGGILPSRTENQTRKLCVIARGIDLLQ